MQSTWRSLSSPRVVGHRRPHRRPQHSRTATTCHHLPPAHSLRMRTGVKWLPAAAMGALPGTSHAVQGAQEDAGLQAGQAMVAAAGKVVDFAMQNQSNAALTLGCVSIVGVLTYKAAAAVLPTVKKVVVLTAAVTAGGVAYAFSQDSSLVLTTAEAWGRNGVDFVLEHPAYTLVASAGLVVVVPKLVRSLVVPALGVAALAAAASHPSETLAIAKTSGEWALDHPRLILAATALLISPYLLLLVVLGGVGYALLEGPSFMVQVDDTWHSVMEAVAHPLSLVPSVSSSLKQARPVMDELVKGGDLPFRAAAKPVTDLPPLPSLPSLRDLPALPALPKPDLSSLPNMNEGLRAAAEKMLPK